MIHSKYSISSGGRRRRLVVNGNRFGGYHLQWAEPTPHGYSYEAAQVWFSLRKHAEDCRRRMLRTAEVQLGKHHSLWVIFGWNGRHTTSMWLHMLRPDDLVVMRPPEWAAPDHVERIRQAILRTGAVAIFG